MNKTILISLASVVVIGAVVYFAVNSKNEKSDLDTSFDQVCVELCAKAKTTCPSLMAGANCESACSNWSDEVKEKVNNASDCQKLSEIPEIVLSLMPEMNTPELPEAKNDCEAACGSYVSKCLTLVPNATQALFEEGMTSCQSECAKWNTQKVDCMINAFDCEAMTNVCGL